MSDGLLQAVVDQAAAGVYADGRAVSPRANRRGELIVADFWTQMLLDGRLYHLQIGTEDAPVASTAAIDDQLGWLLADQSAGYAMIPFAAQVVVANWTTATLIGSMLEADLAKKRYSSGGTAQAPQNMRGDAPFSFAGEGYVGTDITLAAKTAVPQSVELYRGPHVEDAQATPDAAAASVTLDYSARRHSLVAVVGLGALVLHHGVTTADVNSYGFMQFIQIERTKFV